MSVRAYRRITQPQTADTPSFNIWHQQKLVDALLALEGSYDGFTDGGGGTMELNVLELEKFLNSEEFDNCFGDDEYADDKSDIRQALENDISMATLAGDDYITYECF